MKPALFVSMGVVLIFAGQAAAVPTVAPYIDLPPCDAHAITLTHELGNPPVFPADEAIRSSALEATLTGCTVLTPSLPDWEVSITNLTPSSWVDLFFVADLGLPYGNADGFILSGFAFKIDTAGVNAPLLSESIAADLIFSPGETWTFFVLDWDPIANGGPPSLYASIGVGVFSILPSVFDGSNASIVARQLPVPEPGTLLLLAAGAAGLVAARRRKARG